MTFTRWFERTTVRLDRRSGPLQVVVFAEDIGIVLVLIYPMVMFRGGNNGESHASQYWFSVSCFARGRRLSFNMAKDILCESGPFPCIPLCQS